MAIAYAATSVLAGSLSVALLWRWGPLIALLAAPMVASASVLALAGLTALISRRRGREVFGAPLALD
ncbi:MAG TPA: hypothetical protein VGU45_00290 [Microvirga sp.]|jgi:CHASE2 domain-containing sensor protein|nr:hypothetical protein [Microvirga sp.]